MEALFGEASPPFVNRRPQNDDNRSAMAVFPRTLLPWSVIHRPSSGMWIATLQTNQKALDRQNVLEASKSLRAFSMPTEKQAVSLAKAWTPPRMLPFDSNKCCHICSAKFAVFRRPCHCKNCGVCVCKDCTVNWPKTMIPDTYNRKKGNFVNACKSCDWLSKSFRVALLEGDLDKSVALFGTGKWGKCQQRHRFATLCHWKVHIFCALILTFHIFPPSSRQHQSKHSVCEC